MADTRPAAFSTLVLTNTAAGTLVVGGATAAATTGTGEMSSGPIHISSLVPGDNTMKLYNNAGTLTWNGVVLATGSSVSGTTGKIAKFTSASSIGDSIIAESGTTITVTGTLNATTALQLNGASINTAGTLTNVAYQNQSNTFTDASGQKFSAGIGIDGGTPSTHGIFMPSAVPGSLTTNLHNNAGTLKWDGGISDSVGTMATIRGGGLGLTSQAQYDLMTATSSSAWQRIANGTTGQVLTATTAGYPAWASLATAGAWFSTIFEGSARCNPFNYSSASAPTFNTAGVLCNNSNARGSAGVSMYLAGDMGSAGAGLGVFGSFTITTKGTDGTVFLGNTLDSGISISNDTGSMTPKHWGFKVVWSASGAMVLSATQSDGTTESATVMDSGILTSDTVTVYATVNAAGTGINYYYWKNGGAVSAVTSISSNFPTACGRALECSITDNSTSTTNIVQFYGAGIKYA